VVTTHLQTQICYITPISGHILSDTFTSAKLKLKAHQDSCYIPQAQTSTGLPYESLRNTSGDK